MASVRSVLASVSGAAVLLLVCCSHNFQHQPFDEKSVPEGVALYLSHDFGGITLKTLDTGALPFKLVQTAMILQDHEQRQTPVQPGSWPTIVRRFGILTPKRIVYSKDQTTVWNGSPLGLTRKMISPALLPIRVEGLNIGCALCHSGVSYRSDGTPNPDVAWIAAPSTSFNPEAYVNAVYSSLKFALKNEDKTMKAMFELNPDMSWIERKSMSMLVLPRVKRRISELEKALDRPFPFTSGGPGLTNGVAALKFQLGMIPTFQQSNDAALTSVPNLADRSLRSSLLYDGLYYPRGEKPFQPLTAAAARNPRRLEGLAGITAYFTVPTMGVMPDDVEDSLPEVLHAFSDAVLTYRPQPFPGSIDRKKVERGNNLYKQRCASCHGEYAGELSSGEHRLMSFPNRFVPIKDIGTDRTRISVANQSLVQELQKSSFVDVMEIESHDGYVAPILTELWSSAPYLHNGSVPTLWHLMNPSKRPCRFEVGGHALDFKRVGIKGELREGEYRFPPGYKGFSASEVYDCREAGRGNLGHDAEFSTLSASQKSDLIEYLKIL